MIRRLLPRAADTRSSRATWRVLAGAAICGARLTERANLWHAAAVARLMLGDHEGACTAMARSLRGSAPTANPRHVRKAAELSGGLARQHRWLEAIRLLEPVLAADVADYDILREIARLAQQIQRWGGSFVGPATSPPSPRFARLEGSQDPSVPNAEALQSLRQAALRRAVADFPERPAARASLAEVYTEVGDDEAAITHYEQALDLARRAQGRWVFATFHRWQFALEWARWRQGDGRAVDPLFACNVHVPGDAPTGAGLPIGIFDVRVAFNGLRVEGFLVATQEQRIQIQLDGRTVRVLNVGGDGAFPSFGITLQRGTIAQFPPCTQLSVATEGGARLEGRGRSTELRVTLPHATGKLLDRLSDGAAIDKKGSISSTAQELRERQDAYLDLYADLRRFFAEELGKPLMLMYGTLLGYHRDGDLIPGDDDFDAGYISDAHDPIAVKEETKQVIAALVRAGYLISFNRRGRLFRASHVDETLPEMHIDLRPLWFQDGNVWVHNHASFPATVDHFLPVATRTLRGIEVDLPRDTEHFLRGHYGPGWKVPDPGFVYHASDVDPRIRENLSKALITPPEYRELLAELEAERDDNPNMGRFVAVGAQDLYPLDRFIT